MALEVPTLDLDPSICTKCELWRSSKTSMGFSCNKLMGVGGAQGTSIMFISDSPGEAEIRVKKPFAGIEGKILNEQLTSLDIPADICYFTYLVKCKYIQGKLPAQFINACEHHLLEEIKDQTPLVIVPMGKSVCGYFGLSGAMNDIRGIPKYSEEHKCYILPTYSPRYLGNFTVYAPQYIQFKADLMKAWEIAREGLAKESSAKSKYTHLTSIEEIRKAKEHLLSAEKFSTDTETTSLSAQEGEVLMTSFSVAPYQGYSIPYKHPKIFETPSGRREALKELQEIYASPIPKIFHNAKYDVQMLWAENIKVNSLYFDTMLAHYLLDENNPHGLSALAPVYTDMSDYKDEVADYIKGHIKLPDLQLVEKAGLKTYSEPEFLSWLKANKITKKEGFRDSTILDCPLDKLQHYAAQDADATFRLYEIFKPRLIEEGCEQVFNRIVMPLCLVLAKMEYRGILTDKEYIKQLVKKYAGESEESVIKILSSKWIIKYHEKYPPKEGESFNINSPSQKATLLFDVMNLKPYRVNRLTETQKLKGQKTGNPSTDAESLVELARGCKEKILHDMLAHAKIKKFKEFVDSYDALTQKRDTIHTDYNQMGTTTGRLAPRDPNLSQIPKRDPERAKILRNAFIARPGYTLVESDFSSAEFFVWGACSQDQKLKEFLVAKDEKGEYLDIHKQVASTVFHIPIEKVSKDQRNMAKAIVYGLMYGRSNYSIAVEYDMTETEVSRFVTGLFQNFPVAMNWIESQPRLLEKNGFIRSVFGRRRRIAEIYSKKPEEKEAAQRQARNFPIQSGAVDMCYVAMKKIDKLFENYDAHLVLQIHDSVVMEIKEELVHELVPRIQEVMGNAVPKLAQMRVGIEVGKRFGELKPYEEVYPSKT